MPDTTIYHPLVTLTCNRKRMAREFVLSYYAGSPEGFIILGEMITTDDQITAAQAMEQICLNIAQERKIDER